MKTKAKFLLTALLMLFSIGAKAQSGSTPIKGDVNGDGVVDFADINTVIQIIKNGERAEDGKYYWYVGQTDPNTMTKISPIVNDNISPGWRLIGETLPTYSASNMLVNADASPIVTGTSFAKQYIILPNDPPACPRDGFGNDASTVGMYTKWNNTITLNNVVYKVYEVIGKRKKLDADIY